MLFFFDYLFENNCFTYCCNWTMQIFYSKKLHTIQNFVLIQKYLISMSFFFQSVDLESLIKVYITYHWYYIIKITFNDTQMIQQNKYEYFKIASVTFSTINNFDSIQSRPRFSPINKITRARSSKFSFLHYYLQYFGSQKLQSCIRYAEIWYSQYSQWRRRKWNLSFFHIVTSYPTTPARRDNFFINSNFSPFFFGKMNNNFIPAVSFCDTL